MSAHAHHVRDARCATFDSCGSLVDWNAGVQVELARLFDAEHAARLLVVGSYKPALGHWQAFYEATRADRERHVHVAPSHLHDIAPAQELGTGSVLITRLSEAPQPTPTRELPDLPGLADVRDEFVP